MNIYEKKFKDFIREDKVDISSRVNKLNNLISNIDPIEDLKSILSNSNISEVINEDFDPDQEVVLSGDYKGSPFEFNIGKPVDTNLTIDNSTLIQALDILEKDTPQIKSNAKSLMDVMLKEPKDPRDGRETIDKVLKRFLPEILEDLTDIDTEAVFQDGPFRSNMQEAIDILKSEGRWESEIAGTIGDLLKMPYLSFVVLAYKMDIFSREDVSKLLDKHLNLDSSFITFEANPIQGGGVYVYTEDGDVKYIGISDDFKADYGTYRKAEGQVSAIVPGGAATRKGNNNKIANAVKKANDEGRIADIKWYNFSIPDTSVLDDSSDDIQREWGSNPKKARSFVERVLMSRYNTIENGWNSREEDVENVNINNP